MNAMDGIAGDEAAFWECGAFELQIILKPCASASMKSMPMPMEHTSRMRRQAVQGTNLDDISVRNRSRSDWILSICAPRSETSV